MSIDRTQTARGESRGETWLEAIKLLLANGRPYEAFHLVVEVVDPSQSTDVGAAIENEVDSFLRDHGTAPLQTVAETIFPASEYRRNGVEGVYSYPKDVYPHIHGDGENSWGTYAHRLTYRKARDGTEFNPLKQCIDKLSPQEGKTNNMRCCYEIDLVDSGFDLSLFDTRKDRGRLRGGPCLSHVSFKVHNPRKEDERKKLLLAATYRNHSYVERLLGNFLGLAQLQRFICDQADLEPGPMICLSTHAEVDTGPWKVSEVKSLVARCEEIAGASS
jgi:thymidylate synthase